MKENNRIDEIKKKYFPTYEEVIKDYNDFVKKINGITTIEQAKDFQEKYNICIEVNGELINDFILSGGTNKLIEWIRYEQYKSLSYIYAFITNGSIDHIIFDVETKDIDDTLTIVDGTTIDSLEKTYYEENVQNMINKYFLNM